jgi:hypothetical protein
VRICHTTTKLFSSETGRPDGAKVELNSSLVTVVEKYHYPQDPHLNSQRVAFPLSVCVFTHYLNTGDE